MKKPLLFLFLLVCGWGAALAQPITPPAKGSWRSIINSGNYRFTIAGDSGRVFTTLDGGRTWAADTLVTNYHLHDLAITNQNSRTVIGDSGVFALSRNFRQFVPFASRTRARLRAVQTTEDWSGIFTLAVGDSGTIIVQNERTRGNNLFKVRGDSGRHYYSLLMTSNSNDNDAVNNYPFRAINAWMGSDSGKVYRLRKTAANAVPQIWTYNFDTLTTSAIVGSHFVQAKNNSVFFTAADGTVILGINMNDSLPTFRKVSNICSSSGQAITGLIGNAYGQWNYTGLVFFGANGYGSHTNYRNAGIVPANTCFPTGTSHTIRDMISISPGGGVRPFFVFVGDSGLVASTRRGFSEAGGIKADGPTTFCRGGSVVLTDTVNTPRTDFQWFRNGVAISGATLPTLTARDSGTYYLRRRIFTGVVSEPDPTVTNMFADTISNSIRIEFLPAPARPVITLVGSDSLNARVAGASGYTWLFNGQPLTSSDTTGGLRPIASGRYRIVATNSIGCASDTSLVFNYLACGDVPRFLSQRNDTLLCSGNNITLRYTPQTGLPAPANYAWFKNGVQVAGTLNLQTVVDSGSYYVRFTVGACTIFSDTVLIDFDATPAAPTVTPSGAVDLCSGDSVVLTGPAGFARYRWVTGGTTLVTFKDTTANRLVLRAPISNLRLRVITASNCISQTSATINVTAATRPNRPTLTLTGSALTASVTPSVTGVTWRWFLNGVQIGATNSTILNPTPGTYRVIAINRTCLSDTSLEVVVNSTREQLAGARISLSPIPARDQVRISWSAGLTQSLVVGITDLAGRQLAAPVTASPDQGELWLPTSHLAKGVYVVTLSSGDSRQTRRLVIE